VRGVTRVLDRTIALLGWLSSSLERRGTWVPWAVAAGLMVVSLVPVLIVGSTKQPTDISLADLDAQRVPALTAWFRLVGDLSPDAAPPRDGLFFATLRDPQDTGRAVTIVSTAPFPAGLTDVTGRISSESALQGTFQAIDADVPTEPARHDPWLLYSLPALLAIVVLLGLRVGYPIVRGDGAATSGALPLRSGESLAARWSGRIGGDSASVERMRPCSIAVAQDVDICHVTIDEAGTKRTVVVRRAAFRKRMRICWTSGCRPAVQIHGPSADLLLTFDDADGRDRLLASLA
jgi:hypothetical protein